MRKLFLSFLFIFCAFSLLKSQTSIYVYTDKNIFPDDEIKVQVSGYNLLSDKVTFEIYRIKDPLKVATSNFDFLGFNDRAFNELSSYLEFVNSYQKKIGVNKNWFVETYTLDKIREKGSYLLRVLLQDKSSYAFFNCSEIGIISKRSKDEIIVYVSNRKNSQPISDKELNLISIDKKVYTLKTNKDGIATRTIGDRPEDRRFFVVTDDNETTLLLQEIIYSPSDEYDKYLVYTYTNQPVYRPKQKVFFKSIIRERKSDELSVPVKLNVRVKVLMPDNSILFDSNFVTNDYGSLAGSIEIPDEAPIGVYSVNLEISGMNYPASFYVEEYKKPEYKVTIKTEKENYNPSDTVKIKIQADYFFGKPVQSGKVRLLIYRKPLVRYWWEFEPFANFYRSCFVDIIPNYRPELLLEEKGELDDGEFKFEYKVDKDIERNYEYQIVAYVNDETNREVQSSHNFLVTKNKITVTTNPDRYFYTRDSKIILKIITNDFSFKPVKKKFYVLIHRVHYINFAEYYEDMDTLKGETQTDGIGFVTYKTSIGGKYSYTVVVEEDNKKVTARGEFVVGDKELKISGFREGLQIIPAKDIFNEADELEFLVLSVFKDLNVFITLEQSKIYDYKVIKLNGNSAIVKFKKNLPSVVHISAGAYYDNQYLSAIKKFGILENKQKLNIEISSDKEIYKPGEKGKFKIRVTDYQGKPVKNAELSSSIIDESIYSIKPEKSGNIFEVFTQSSIYKILTTNTELPYFINKKEYFLQQLIQFKELKKKGNGIITGLVFNSLNSEIIPDAEVKLISGDRQLIAKTNKKGEFTFKNLPDGTYDLIIDNPRYYKFILPQIKINERYSFKRFRIGLFPAEVDKLQFSVKDLFYRGEVVLFKQVTTQVMPEGMQNKEELVKEQFVEPVIRKDFKDAIFWDANLVTDQNGEVGIELNYPDNITSWRNTIKAITRDSKAGESFYNVIVRKDILIRVETPRYLHEKDEVILPVMIHNYSSKEQKVKVSFDVINGKIISDYNERMNQKILDMNVLTIKSNDAVKLNLKIKVNENVDTLFITAKALVLKSDEQGLESDAIQLKLPVESIGYPDFIVNNSSLSKNTEKYSSRIYLSDDKRNLKVVLKMSPTLIGNILSSIDELVAYPYGCVEQTMSRFLPAIIVANLNRELNLDIKQKTLEQLPEIISAGLKRLKDFQHTDGGWGWWKDDQTNPFMTAYVMYGLSITRKAGFDVDRRMIENGLIVLRNLLKGKNENENIDTYLLYSFSEVINFDGASKEDRELLINKFNELKKFNNNPYIISKLLEIAVENGLSDEINKLKNRLLKLATVEGNIVYWGEKDFYNRHFVNDPVEITSSAIRSLIISGEKSNLIENAIRWLVNQKRGNFWFSTKQTASVIFSLSEYIKSSDELKADFNVRILVNGKEIKSIKFDKNNLKAGELNFVIPPSELKSGMNEIEIEKSGRGKLYLSIIEKYFKTRIEKNENLFEVERKYYVLSYEKEDDKLVKKITELKDEVKVGQEILVELKVKTKTDFEYFMLEDPFVPGFERLVEQPHEEYFQRWFYHYKEERDQKTAFFVTNLTRGEYIFNYTAYAQIPGIYTIPPAVASLMYYPEVRSIGEEKVIKVTD